ncbi:AMP-binding protein [Streptomyces sp. NPDC051994]|uniref:AMP-binding protein n=2 Tax=Streptomyces TaxID=1883 RepID=UPI0034266B90
MSGATGAPAETTTGELRLEDRVRRTALRHPGREALRIGPRRLTYAELVGAADAWAAVLRSAHPDGEPQRIAVLAERGHTGYVGILAGLIAGATVCPLDPQLPTARLMDMLRDCPPDCVIADGSGVRALAAVAAQRPVPPVYAPEVAPSELAAAKLAPLDGHAARSLGPRRRPARTAYVLFTSGSTGRPKGVPITHANMDHFLTAVLDRYRFTAQDVFTQTFGLTFDLAFFDLFVTWACGGTLVYTPPAAFARIGEFAAREGITVWFSVPSAIDTVRRFGGLTPAKLPTLRWSLFCGEPLTWEDADAWHRAAPHSAVENVYGPTEVTIACSAHRWDPDPAEAGPHGTVPIGCLFPGLDHLLIDELGQVDSLEGELCVAGPQTFDGYLNRADDEGRFVRRAGRDWYRTGDLVRKGGDGRLFHLGRTDHQTKIRGYRIEPAEIEYRIRSVPGVRAAAVLAVGEGAERRLTAWYVGPGVPADLVGQRLREVLPGYLLPGSYIALERLPLNSRGKVDRMALAATAAAEPRGDVRT